MDMLPGCEFPVLHIKHSVTPISRYRQLKQQLDLKSEEAQILETKVQQSSFHKQQEELENLQRTIGTLHTLTTNYKL